MDKYCLQCNTYIPALSKQWKNQKYCSQNCRKAAHNRKTTTAKRVQSRRSNLLQNDETLRLISQCRRAKTVQILKSHDLESFCELMTLLRERPPGDVDLCHIVPVSGKYAIGLLHPKNLFYGGAYQNKKSGNRYHAGGLAIDKAELLRKWKVTKQMTNNDILLKVEEYLGNIIPLYIEKNPVRKSRKASICHKILELDDSQSFEKLIRSHRSRLIERLEGLTNTTQFKHERKLESKFLAYMNELSRFIEYGDRSTVFTRLRKTLVIGYMALSRILPSKTYNRDFYIKYEPLIELRYGQAMLKNPGDWSAFKDMLYDTTFEVLLGRPLNSKKFHKKVLSEMFFPKRAWLVKDL